MMALGCISPPAARFWAIRTRKCGCRRYRLVNGARGGKNRIGDRADGRRGVGQALPQVMPVAVVEPLPPIIDRPAADAEGLGDLLDRLALVEPEQRLGAAPLLGDGVVGGQVFQLRALPGGEYEGSHRSTCEKAMESEGSLLLCKDF